MLSDYRGTDIEKDDFYKEMYYALNHSYLLKKVRNKETTFREIGQPFIDKSIKVEQEFYDSNRIFSSRKEIIGKDDRSDLGYLAQQLYQEDIIDVKDFFYSRIKLRKRNAARSRGWRDGPGRDALAGLMAGMTGMAVIPFGGGSMGGALGVAGASAALGIGAYRSLNLVQNSLCTSFESDRNYLIQALDTIDALIQDEENYIHKQTNNFANKVLLALYRDMHGK